jgi:hypothetical protein
LLGFGIALSGVAVQLQVLVERLAAVAADGWRYLFHVAWSTAAMM